MRFKYWYWNKKYTAYGKLLYAKFKVYRLLGKDILGFEGAITLAVAEMIRVAHLKPHIVHVMITSGRARGGLDADLVDALDHNTKHGITAIVISKAHNQAVIMLSNKLKTLIGVDWIPKIEIKMQSSFERHLYLAGIELGLKTLETKIRKNK